MQLESCQKLAEHLAYLSRITQLYESCQLKTAVRDRDGLYGEEVSRCLKSMDVEEIITAPHSPWQNGHCERLVGTLRREMLDHVIVLNSQHLLTLLDEFFLYYHEVRPHRALGQNAPDPRTVEPPDLGEVISIPHVSGLHHRYTRAA